VLALAGPIEPEPLDAVCGFGERTPPPFLLVVAGVYDPHNLGSLLRSAECAGVSGVVLPRHRTTNLSPTVMKVAAGAAEHLSFSLVGGIAAALGQITGYADRTLGMEAGSAQPQDTLDVADGPVALVVGGEERGLAPLVRRRCSDLVSIPQLGAISSLNVAAAGAVGCFEIARQRRARGAVAL
jgi:23S rRNA (guanosine2251-2'-O)-methyltransferase